MQSNEKGFTLIELVIVIVILGLLAAVALPKYQDLRSEAALAAANGVYGGASAAAAINFATRLVTPSKIAAITTGATLLGAMQSTPEGWSATGTSGITNGTYRISITALENPTGATVPTTMAALTKSW